MFCKESQSVFVLVSTYLCVCFARLYRRNGVQNSVHCVHSQACSQMTIDVFTKVFEVLEKRDKKAALKSRILPGAISGATLGGYSCRCLHISA